MKRLLAIIAALLIPLVGLTLPAHAKPAPPPPPPVATYPSDPSAVKLYDPSTGTQPQAPTGAAAATTTCCTAANAYVDRIFPSNAHPYVEHGAQLSVEQEQPSKGYFYSDQFGFNAGNGGYIGLQNHLWVGYDAGKGFIWSIFGAETVDTSPCAAAGCVAVASSEPGGAFLSIRMPFQWTAGWSYEVKLQRGHTGDALNQRVDAYITDLNHNLTYWLGAIGVPAAWGGFQSTTYQWIENYIGNPYPNCSDILRTSAVFGGVTWLATPTSGRVGITGQVNHIASGANICPNSNSYWLGGGADRLVIGAYS